MKASCRKSATSAAKNQARNNNRSTVTKSARNPTPSHNVNSKSLSNCKYPTTNARSFSQSTGVTQRSSSVGKTRSVIQPRRYIQISKEHPQAALMLDPKLLNEKLNAVTEVSRVSAPPANKIEYFNHLLKTSVERGNMKDCPFILNEMQREGVQFQTSTYNTFISSFLAAKRPIPAILLYETMKPEKVKPDISTHNMIIKAMFENGQLAEACKIIADLEREGQDTPISTYNILIEGLLKHNKLNHALRVFELVINLNLTPDEGTFIPIVRWFQSRGDFGSAQAVLQHMQNAGINHEIVHSVRRLLLDSIFKQQVLAKMSSKGKGKRQPSIVYQKSDDDDEKK